MSVEEKKSDRQGLSSPTTITTLPQSLSCKRSSRERKCEEPAMLLFLLLMTIFTSQQISASILHLHGQTLVPSGEGATRQKTKKLFLGNEADNIPPAEARKRLRKLVAQFFSTSGNVFFSNAKHFPASEYVFFLSFQQVDEMDEDKDGLLTVSELARWIERKQTDQVTM